MIADRPIAHVLIGPRSLDDRICRLMYVRETDEAWTEEWCERQWKRVTVLVRHLMKAPAPPRSALRKQGIPNEPGEWDQLSAGH
ncbi:hypothetical protein BH23GEM6_BH23GEM6_15840 [soil metagenome]